ncbi:hypothetical protein [Mangrovibacillus cuniculi]|uniref:Permuted papain-like amidase enzyme, YaeF/YiiX, C92 family n=1 Tax=Mangrovibacillus cuniculi TaxID=2593652 RepID=A0A7S8C9M8_9BACI|nr:hypothetical protein [Mangrovibacillus cuniculi]QPC45929.1 hypothetical protein G8O30_02630 [Mangrovibacillus cuniculi]
MTGNTYIYILLSDTGTLFTRSIKVYTKAPYNHASISFAEDLSDMYSFGRLQPRNPLSGGFVKEDVWTGTYSKYPKTTCIIYRLEVTEREVKKMKRILEVFIKNKEKFSYNLLGVLGVSVEVPIESRKAYFCSQFVWEILQRSGIRLWDKIPALVTPDDFRKSDRLEPIYEGLLLDYPPRKK